MSPARALFLVCSVLALAACGSTTREHAAQEPSVAAMPPPAIERIDEPAPDAGWQAPPADGDAVVKTTWSMCFSEDGKDDGRGECKASPDQVEHLRQMEAELERAFQPAKGTEPRAIAQLRLPTRGQSSRARLAAWRNEAGKLCAEIDVESDEGGGGGGPTGPCVPRTRRTKLFLDLSGDSGSDGVYAYLVGGLVASQADDLRITLDDGRVEDYRLSGPLVPGFPTYRVFILDLGRDLYRRLELRRDGKAIAEEEVSDAEIRMMRCEDSAPPALPSPGGRSTHSGRCIARAASK